MDKLRGALLKNWTFPIITALLCSAVFAASHLFIYYGTGIFSEIAVAQMLADGVATGDYAAAAGFAAGFLIARVLEGPLVGILDLGGSIQTGVGIGVPAILLSAGIEAPLKSFPLALLTGAAIGIAMGALIIGVKKTMPENMAASGTNVMMGAGNATGRYLGPLVVLSAINYSIPAGIGALIGAAIFFKLDKAIVGGAILGAMLLAVIFPIPPVV
ncbi:MAG: DUF4310 family protein [Angelakisella sp.]